MQNKKTTLAEDRASDTAMKLKKVYFRLVEMLAGGQIFDEADSAEFTKLRKALGYTIDDFGKHIVKASSKQNK